MTSKPLSVNCFEVSVADATTVVDLQFQMPSGEKLSQALVTMLPGDLAALAALITSLMEQHAAQKATPPQ